MSVFLLNHLQVDVRIQYYDASSKNHFEIEKKM